MNAVESLKYFIPELVLLGGAFAAFTLDFFVKQKKLVGEFALLVIVLALCLAQTPKEPLHLFFGMFELDTFAHFFRYLALGAVGVTAFAAGVPTGPRRRGAFSTVPPMETDHAVPPS